MVFKLVRVDGNAQDASKVIFPEGCHYIGRGPLFNCDDLKVSVKQGFLKVSENIIYLQAVDGKNPCFVKEANSNNIIVLNDSTKCPLYNGYRIGFLPNEYWYEVISHLRSPFAYGDPANEADGVDEKELANTESYDFLNEIDNSNSGAQKRAHEDDSSNEAKSDLESPHSYVMFTPEGKRIKMESKNGNIKSEGSNSNSRSDGGNHSGAIKLHNGVQCNSSSAQAGSSTSNVTRRQQCKYNAECYRMSSQHREEYSHPEGWNPWSVRMKRKMGAKRRRKNLSTSESNSNRDSGLILPDKRARKTITREREDCSESEEDPYKTDGSDDSWTPSD